MFFREEETWVENENENENIHVKCWNIINFVNLMNIHCVTGDRILSFQNMDIPMYVHKKNENEHIVVLVYDSEKKAQSTE